MNWEIVRWVDIYIGIPLAYLMLWARKILPKTKACKADNNFKKILLVKFWGIGNIIMLLPCACALKAKYPNATLDILTLHSNTDISKTANLFNNVYTINTGTFINFITTYINRFNALKNQDYDLIIDFEQFSRSSALSCALIGKKVIVGFRTYGQHRGFLYTHPVTYNNNIHTVDSFFNLIGAVGITDNKYKHSLPIDFRADDLLTIKNILGKLGFAANENLVVIHTGTSHNCNFRHWPAEHFAKLTDKLIDNFKVSVVFTGLKEETTLINEVLGYMRNKERAIDCSGALNIRQLFALIKISQLVISADTAPIHIASYLNVPVAGLYGPNTPLIYGPWGEKKIWFYKNLHCSPCITNYNAKINKCTHPLGKGSCMREISPEEVFLEIKNNYFNHAASVTADKIS